MKYQSIGCWDCMVKNQEQSYIDFVEIGTLKNGRRVTICTLRVLKLRVGKAKQLREDGFISKMEHRGFLDVVSSVKK